MKGHEQSIDYLKSACSKDVMAAGSGWEIITFTAVHPGEHLAEELKALDMSAAELARKINVPANRVTQILKGTRSVTGDTTLRLVISLARVRNFGLISRASTSYGSRRRKQEKQFRSFSDSNAATSLAHDTCEKSLRSRAWPVCKILNRSAAYDVPGDNEP